MSSTLLVVIAFAIAGCDGGNPASNEDGGTFRPGADVELSGARSFSSLTIPDGVTVRVTGDLSLHIAGDATITGHLAGDCVRIDLRADGAVLLSGRLSNACSGEPPRTAPGLSVTAGQGFRASGAVVASSGDVTLGNDPPGAPSEAGVGRAPRPAQTSSCAFENSRLAAEPARAASGEEGPVGGAGVAGGSWTIACRGEVALTNTTLVAQGGGAGGAGRAAGAPAVASGGTGGAGGAARIRSGGGASFAGVVNLVAGAGGPGGSAEATADSSAPGSAERSATARGGDGGPGGRVVLESAGPLMVTGPLGLELGASGAGGDALAIGADGAAASEGSSAGAGGAASATGGAGGVVPDKTLDTASTSGSDNVFVRAGAGGDGGRAEAHGGRGGDGVPTDPDGGSGGPLQVRGGDGGASLATDLAGSPVGVVGSGGPAIGEGGAGGDGSDVCAVPGVSEITGQGGHGGDAGRVVVRDGRPGEGGRAGSAAEPGGGVLSDVGNGGDGGSGEPPGDAGAAAEAELDVARPLSRLGRNFNRGSPGIPCLPVLVVDVVATVRLAPNGDPAGLDPRVFDIPTGPANPNQQPTGSVDHPLTVVLVGNRITIDGPEPWVRVEGEIQADRSFVAIGTGTVAGVAGATAEYAGLFVNQGLSGTLTLTVPGAGEVRYTVISRQF